MINGLAIGEYRSIGEIQYIGPFGKINLFVGPNNAGKSNILRFINENLTRLTSASQNRQSPSLPSSSHHLRRGKPTHGAIGVSTSLAHLQNVLKPSTPDTNKLVSVIHERLNLSSLLWIDERWPSNDLVGDAITWAAQHVWYNLWHNSTNQNGGGIREHWVPEVFQLLRQLILEEPNIFTIPVNRQAGSQVETKSDDKLSKILSGVGIIRSLAAMQNPKHSTFEEDRKRFESIQNFLRVVTDDSSARISVTHEQDEILVQMKGQPFFPLSSLGSGIEQVILHAVAASAATNAIVTFEEPELHLHPVLQRQLIAYLVNTSNQYFISTHSAHLIDAIHADTFHVRLVDGESRVEKAITDAQRHRVCTELGYRPSDIVQANCIIWVEGPSDRIYIRHWLSQVDKHLKEHLHFSIMFYGGKLLSHLSASITDTSDAGLDDLIKLRLLNRYIAVVIDSDLKNSRDSIRDTKTRVRNEVEAHGGIVWITAGREIENYVPHETLVRAVDQVNPGRGNSVGKSRYARVLPTVKPSSKFIVDKIAVAEKVEQLSCSLDLFDLKLKIHELAAFVRASNGLPASS